MPAGNGGGDRIHEGVQAGQRKDAKQRVADDLEWFIDKFDYRHKDEPWKNSKDALPRAMNKLNSISAEEQE